ncbi:prenyltransferase/squalene oxidase repeat-containing protein [Nocardia terpenica]|uniref:Squalene cyclase C-terminal domain-containing protein n=1 Tax=Nocardia terpenica TaxID=455432 RepID=A0A291RPG6_9NOCA|nr:prenyltransferase/squalene oxidase repeat-containing protein [Nocardia terpenica]ATL69215.1 hypothetical protein CRH09_26605 [Nocardia terpenica]
MKSTNTEQQSGSALVQYTRNPNYIEIQVARMRLAAYLAARIDESGPVHNICLSRVLESALLLALLRKVDMYPTVQSGLLRYLSKAHPVHPIDNIIIAAALNRDGPTLATRPNIQLDMSLGPVKSRKHTLATTVLALLDAIPDNFARYRPPNYRGYARWTELALCASKILDCHARHQTADTAVSDRRFLLHQLRHGSLRPVWEGNLFAHLIALHALYELQPRDPFLHKQIQIIVQTRNSDGGIPFIDSQSIFLTALTGIELAHAGASHSLLQTVAAYIAHHQSAGGGWPYTDRVIQTDVDTTNRCLEFLRKGQSRRYATNIIEGENYLTSIVRPDGGFPTYDRRHSADLDMTAGSIIAFAPARARFSRLISKAIEYLVTAQHIDGTFDRSWTLSESSLIARVLAALHTVPRSAPTNRAIAASLSRLRSTRNIDGGWGHSPGEPSDVTSTAHALTALTSFGASIDLSKSIVYLLNHQRIDGSYLDRADQVGPRPYPYHFPIYTCAIVLQSLNRLADGFNITDRIRLPSSYYG